MLFTDTNPLRKIIQPNFKSQRKNKNTKGSKPQKSAAKYERSDLDTDHIGFQLSGWTAKSEKLTCINIM